MFTITRKEAKTLLAIATSYDYLSGDAGVAVTQEMMDDHAQRLLVLQMEATPELLATAPIAHGWAATHDWLSNQNVQG